MAAPTPSSVAGAASSSSTWSDTYVNTFTQNPQVIPSAVATTSDNDASLTSTKASFPTAAIIVVSIVAGIAALIIGYKVYRCIWSRRHNTKTPLPSVRDMSFKRPPSALNLDAAELPMAQRPGHFQHLDSVRSSIASYGDTAEANLMSPTTPDSAPLSPDHSVMSTNYLRTAGSRASLAASNHRNSMMSISGAADNRRRSTLGMHSSSSASISSSNYPQPRPQRLSGAPHSRFSQIEIVPPLPLAPPPGSVVSVDKATLAFSTKSGISGLSGDDESQSERLFDPDVILQKQRQQEEFAAAKAAYLAGSKNQRAWSPSGSSSMGYHSRNDSVNGPFQDPSSESSGSSTRLTPSSSVADVRIVDSSSPELELALAEEFGAGGKATAIARLSGGGSSGPVAAPTSPLDKLQAALLNESRRGREADRRSAINGSRPSTREGRDASLDQGFKAPSTRLDDMLGS